MKHVGIHAYRLEPEQSNQREVAFSEQWQLENDQSQILEWICGNGIKKSPASDRDVEIVASVIQWLGSNVGISFIQEAAKRSPELAQALSRIKL